MNVRLSPPIVLHHGFLIPPNPTIVVSPSSGARGNLTLMNNFQLRMHSCTDAIRASTSLEVVGMLVAEGMIPH